MKERKAPGEDEHQPYEVRELRSRDIDRGLLETLGNLSDLEDLTSEGARGVLAAMRRSSLHRVIVAVAADGQVIGATTLLVEQKFIHRGGLVGHIEDVSVRKGYQGRGIGGALVKAGVEMAEGLGCYKVILDCKEELAGFYERLGFKRWEIAMRIDLKRRPSRRR